MKHFDHATAARRYASGRPFFHPHVVELIRGKLGLAGRIPCALDVACGTGQSTRALLAIAERVFGVDVSEAMLGQCPRDDGMEFRRAAAEAIPFADRSFPLVTVCMGFHWFDQPAFLSEATRLLAPGGHLAVYNCYFRGEMKGVPGFQTFIRNYLSRFPSPPRGATHPDGAAAGLAGFEGLGREPYELWIPLTRDQLASYLMTQTNVIETVEHGGRTIDEVQNELDSSLSPCFSGTSHELGFSGDITFWRKHNPTDSRRRSP